MSEHQDVFDSTRVDQPEEIKRKLQEQTYTVNEVAEILGCGAGAVRKLCKERTFPALRIGAGYKIPKAAFQEWLYTGIFVTKKEVEVSAFQRSPRAKGK